MPTIAIRDVASLSLIRSRVSCLNDQSPFSGILSVKGFNANYDGGGAAIEDAYFRNGRELRQADVYERQHEGHVFYPGGRQPSS